MKNLFIFTAILLFVSSCSFADQPNCTGQESWPASMAFVNLKNARITNNEKVDFNKTTVKRLASEHLKSGIFKQIHFVTFVEKDGTIIEVITINEASFEECSHSDVDVFKVNIISNKLPLKDI